MEAISAVGGSDYSEIVQASEILEKIQKGSPVQYDNAIVRGNLDLSQIALPEMRVNRTVFETKILGLSQDANLIISPIEIRNATFEGNTNFENTVFYGSVDFSGSNFTSFATFHGAQFGAMHMIFQILVYLVEKQISIVSSFVMVSILLELVA